MITQTTMALSSSRASLLLPLLCLLLAGVAAAANHQQQHPTPASPPITLPGCPDKCGNVNIPYPFGIKDGCFLPGFFIVCNHTFDPPRPFINSTIGPLRLDTTNIAVQDVYYLITNLTTNLSIDDPPEVETKMSFWPIELAGVSLLDGKARLLSSFCYQCRLNKTHSSERRLWIDFNSDDSPFLLSDADNMLMAIGGNVIAEQADGPLCQSYVFNPLSYTGTGGAVNGSCSGQGCCQAKLAPFLTNTAVGIQKDRYDVDDDGSRVHCSYAMIVEKTWYNFSSADLDNDAFLQRNGVGAARAGVIPFMVDFTVDIGTCPEAGKPKPKDFACISDNSECVDRWIPNRNKLNPELPVVDRAHYCRCSVGYEGNPYIQGGCQDINECDPDRPDNKQYPCHGNCMNTPGDYECSCRLGTRGNAKEAPCTDLFPLPAKISVGVVGGLFIIALLVFIILIRNEKKKMTEFFKKNGGPTLEKAKSIKIYRKEELNPILKRSNFIGRGAFGEVYKGFLENQLVAVKKPIEVMKPTDGNDDVQNNQFANEVIIQSQVIHKNIVKLIGCCLEVDKPMLVYEFLPKGSLDDILHGSNRTSITLECRLNIAAESAEGLAYLHSKTTNIILHGDVKPANILLDDSFKPKISDFGISRLLVIDKEHTDFIIGDRTYMDPVYLRDGLLTDKSDVYSFGVVLLELISRKKATYVDNNSLVRNFLDAHKSQKEPTELFDKEIAKPEALKLLYSLYEIAVNCLNLDVDKRTNMIEVAESLLMLKRSWSNILTSHVPID